MAWNKPTLSELISRVESDFSTKFFGSAAPLRRGVLKILARVWAGLVYLLHLYLSWIYDQCFAHLADGDQLDRHGQEIGVPRKAATFSSGLVEFSGLDGVTIPQGTLVQTVSGKIEYQTTADVTISGGIAQVTITAIDAGAAGDQLIDTVFERISPISDVNDTLTAVEAISGGADREVDGDPGTTQAYRGRILFKKRNPPQGGADADYIIRATSIQPVTDAWVFANYPETNSVTVRVANYDQDPPTLTPAELQDVIDALTDRTWKPVTADVRVATVIPSQIVVAAKITPLTSQTRAAADTELRDLFSAQGKREDEPGAPGTMISLSDIQNAIYNATGVRSALVTAVTQDGVTVGEISLDINHVARLSGSSYLELT